MGMCIFSALDMIYLHAGLCGQIMAPSPPSWAAHPYNYYVLPCQEVYSATPVGWLCGLISLDWL